MWEILEQREMQRSPQNRQHTHSLSSSFLSLSSNFLPETHPLFPSSPITSLPFPFPLSSFHAPLRLVTFESHHLPSSLLLSLELSKWQVYPPQPLGLTELISFESGGFTGVPLGAPDVSSGGVPLGHVGFGLFADNFICPKHPECDH